MRRRRGRGMERWMDGRERDVFYITIAFLEDSFCRGKRRSENGERERERRKREEKRKEKQESEKRLVQMRTAKHFLRASAWLHRERDRTRLTSQQRLFFSFFFSRLLCFSTFALCFLFYCRNDVNDDDDTDAENQFHPHFADKNNTVILYWSILRASG